MGNYSGFPWQDRSWSRIYRNRMDLGLEHCRQCHTNRDLTFDHIRPRSLRGSGRSMSNLTILCFSCNTRRGNRPARVLVSLADEEAAAPPERRWSQLGEQWDPQWTPPECSARIYVVNGKGCEPTLRCNLPEGHGWWHWDDEVGLWGSMQGVAV
jgi:hypothetical protein